MPRIPLYDPSVQLTHLGPDVEQDKMSFGLENMAAAKNWEGMGKLGEKLTEASLEITKQLKHSQDVNEVINARAFMGKALQDAHSELYQSADSPHEWLSTYESRAQTIKEAAEEMLTSRAAKAHFQNYFNNAFLSGRVKVIGAARSQQIQNYAGDYRKQFSTTTQAAIDAPGDTGVDDFRIIFSSGSAGAVAAGYIHAASAEQAKLNWEQTVKVGRYQKLAAVDTVTAKANIANYGFDEETASKMVSWADQQQRRLQQTNADNLDNQFMRGTGVNADPNIQLPTQQQVYDLQKSGSLASHDAWRFDKILEGMKNNPGDKSDTSTKTRLWSGIVPDDDGKITTTREMILDPQNQLSANDRIAMLKDLRATDRQDAKGIVTFERGQLSSIKNALGPNYYQRFYNDYLTEKKTGNWGTEAEIEQNINRIADPWLQKVRNRGGAFSNQPPPQPGWGATIHNFFTGGGNASTQPPAGTVRVLNKRTGQMELVTPEQFNQIQQNQRGLR